MFSKFVVVHDTRHIEMDHDHGRDDDDSLINMIHQLLGAHSMRLGYIGFLLLFIILYHSYFEKKKKKTVEVVYQSRKKNTKHHY